MEPHKKLPLIQTPLGAFEDGIDAETLALAEETLGMAIRVATKVYKRALNAASDMEKPHRAFVIMNALATLSAYALALAKHGVPDLKVTKDLENELVEAVWELSRRYGKDIQNRLDEHRKASNTDELEEDEGE